MINGLVSSAISKNYLIGIDTLNAYPYYNSTLSATYGLANLRFYTILAQYTVVDDAKASHILYQVRNPNGTDATWKGVWKDSSTKWTTITKSQVPYVNKDDGLIFVEDYELVWAFQRLTIGYYSESYAYEYV